MQQNIESFYDYLTRIGGKEGTDETWVQLSQRFNIVDTPGNKPGDKARQLWKRYKKRKKKEAETTIGEIYETLRTRRAWEQRTKDGNVVLLRSYENEVSPEDYEQLRKDLIEDVKEWAKKPCPSKVDIKSADEERYMIEISMPDFHLGRMTIEEGKKLYIKAFRQILVKALKAYTPDEIVLVVGNDLFNSDNERYTTTKGTQQFDKDKWHEVFRAGWQIAAESIEIASHIAPVKVICVMGNHDRTRVMYMSDVLHALFDANPLVEVNNEFEDFKFHQYGNSLIMYEHGELKPQQYPLIMATQAPIMWSQSTYREVHTGHFHKERLFEENGVKVRFLPSLAVESDWEKSKGYSHLRQAQSLVWSKDKGLEAIFHWNYDYKT